jgi:hypothetical protein
LNLTRRVATIDRMARKPPSPRGDETPPPPPPPPESRAGRHKPSKMYRVPKALSDLLEEVAREELGTSASEQLKFAIREYLQRKGKLPRRD